MRPMQFSVWSAVASFGLICGFIVARPIWATAETDAVQLSSKQTPLVFEPNQGQAASVYRWIGRGAGFRIGITAEGTTIEILDRTIATPAKPLFPTHRKRRRQK